jgi:hypothetical protein
MILTTIALVAQASPAPAASPTDAPTPAPDPKVLATAQSWFASLQNGKILDANDITEPLAKVLTPTALATVAKDFAPLKTPTGFDQAQILDQGGVKYYFYYMTFKEGAHFLFIIGFDDKTNKVALLKVAPPQ